MPLSIPLPQVKFGKIKKRSQICEILTDDGRWVDRELPVEYSCVVWEEAGLKFLLDPDNQYLAEDGLWHQILTETSAVPLCPNVANKLQDGKNDEAELKKLGNE